MSCTVVAVPVLLFHVVTVVTGTSLSLAALAYKNATQDFDTYNTQNESVKNLDNIYQGENTFTAGNLIEKDFETQFMDEEVLVKTLEEHGVQNLETKNGIITGGVDNFALKFEKTTAELPYHLYITCNEKCNAEEKVNDISSEYALNVQEAAYLSIIEKLKEQNMQIEEENVEEDNTIVLTINLE